jgi:uncharacterized delta-60 repeat protein
MTIQPDGKIIASGFIELQSGIQDILLIRINPDGTPDTSFSEDGIVTTDLSGFADFGLHVMLQPDNKIIIAGYSGYAAVALRYHTDGVIDSSFGINGAFSFTINNSGAGAEILGGVIRSDGKIILTGTAYTPYNKFMLLIQLLPNGICDSTFDGDGILIPFDICGNAMEYANDVKIQADGKIVVAGSTFKYDDYGSGFSHLMLARFNSDGSWDSAFNAIGITGTGGGPDDKYTGSSLVIQPEGKLIVSGYISSFNDADPVMVLVRFNIDGIPDSSFGTNGQAKTIINHGEYAFAAVLQADGKIIESGYTCDYGDCKNVVCRFNNDVATVISNVSDPFAENFFFSPNPFTDFTTIHFFLYESEEFKIEVVDLYGRKIKTISAGKPVAGNHTLIFQKDNLAAGVYSVNLSTASGTISRKIIIL